MCIGLSGADVGCHGNSNKLRYLKVKNICLVSVSLFDASLCSAHIKIAERRSPADFPPITDRPVDELVNFQIKLKILSCELASLSHCVMFSASTGAQQEASVPESVHCHHSRLN